MKKEINVSLTTFQKRTNLLTNIESKWHENEIKTDKTENQICNNLETLNKYRNLAKQLYEQDVTNYENFREKTRRSDHNWVKTVLNNGTINDKISANCILIQDSPIHNVRSLDNLIQMVKINKKRECLLAIDALKDLFINHLLPNRELKNFNEHSFESLEVVSNGNKDAYDKQLVVWYYESMLKAKYLLFIRSVQAVFHDTIAVTKVKISSTINDLLCSNKIEQEKLLIETLINKLGDPDYKVASKIVFEIKKLLTKRPKKKMDVLLEVERLIYRPNISEKAQYYGFCCINQFVLTRHDADVANRLIVVYFSFFKKFIKNKEIDSRMLSVILTGVNRAYKFAKMNHEEIDNNVSTLFKIVHITPFNVAIQSLMLLNQVVDSRDDMLSRYYNALYRKMFDLEVKNTSKDTYFLNLLFNSLNKDEAIPRIKAFVKRLLQISCTQNVPFTCGSMMLLSELAKSKGKIFQFDGSLLVKVEKTFVKSNASNGTNKSIKNGASKIEDDDDEEEHFVDIKDQSDTEEIEEKNEKSKNNLKRKNADKTSWIHKQNNQMHKTYDTYDYTQRNPLYSGADKTLTYELLLLSRHYHPSVAVFANKLMNDDYIDYNGNPMEDFTLIHFLDRFVYKNPKKESEKKAKKIKSVFSSKIDVKQSGVQQVAVNTKEYLSHDYKHIPEDEKFFYDYFKKQSDKNVRLGDNDSVAGSVSDSEFDEFLIKTETDGTRKDEDWDLDIADAITTKPKKGKKKKNADDEDEDDDDFEMSDDDDDEVDFDNDDDYNAAMEKEIGDIEGDDEEDEGEIEEIDENDDDELFNKKLKNSKEDISSLFAAADEFSELIDEENKYDEKGFGAINKKDKADVKQLKWEMKRTIDNSKWKMKNKGGNKFGGRSGGKFNKKSKVNYKSQNKKVKGIKNKGKKVTGKKNKK